MKKFVVVSSIVWVSLSAQTPSGITPSFTGVSDTFQQYARQNPAVPSDDTDVEVPNIFYIPRNAPLAPTPSPAVAAAPSTMYSQTANGPLPVSVTANYVGLGNGFQNWTNQGVLPPDTTLAVGNNQIVQWVNLRLTVLNKLTGLPLLGGAGYVNGNQIWSGLSATSVCRTSNNGDPTLQYDRMSNRWILTQFAFNIVAATNGTTYPSPPYAACFAVSQTNDATAGYNLYEFHFPFLTDYPKIGVWPDGLYWTANDFSYNTATGSGSYVGTRLCAFDRLAMVAGGPGNGVCFSGLDAQHFASLPGDFEGTLLPPANTTEYIVSVDWFTKNNPPYFLQLRRFHPDLVTPSNSTLDDGYGGGPDSFVSLPFDNSVIGACGDNGGFCVPQPGTTRLLDTLSMRPMYRLAYRNLNGNRESLVFTETVTPPGAVAGIQLVEIRNPGANPPSIYNNVNFAPDTTNRWMGGAATDSVGNIGLGYSVSSAILSPGIRISGRLRNDIRSRLRGELNVTTGTGAQTSSFRRWGDYSTMQIDPDDDCTFWYTTEYVNNTSLANWATEIIGFRFDSCQ